MTQDTSEVKEEKIVRILTETVNAMYPGKKGFFGYAPGVPRKLKMAFAVFIQRAAKRLSKEV